MSLISSHFKMGFCVFAMLFSNVAFSQERNSIWTDVSESAIELTGQRGSIPSHYRTLHLSGDAMKQLLARVPKEPTDGSRAKNGLLFSMPMPDGTFSSFTIYEINIMHPELAAKFPDIKTYAGQGIDDANATIRLDFTPLGFHAMILSPKGNIFIDPYCKGNISDYICYDKKDLRPSSTFNCETANDDPYNHRGMLPSDANAQKSSGTSLRTYRLALACTGEYAATKGGTVAGALAGMTTTMNRVDGVYETEVAVRLVMVANNNLLVYTNSSTDPYTNNNGSTMLTQNQNTCNSVIGSANYDIGHVFSTGGGGVAYLGCVCTANKAGGVTGLPNPVGDAFDIDYVAHEMGHQHGGNHTFNSTTGSCGGGNRAASAAYEPGSGITIMAYAGICGSDDLAAHSIAYFHTYSFDEIVNYTITGSGSTCGTTSATGNNVPVVTNQGNNFTIPISTPFVLTGAATDADNDPLTFSWDQMDLGTAGAWNANLSTAPLFRPFSPVTSPSRTFPQLSDIINNTTTVGEILPNVARTMHFRLTARDNRMGGGGVMHPDVNVAITVVNSGGAFAVIAPNTMVTWAGGSSQTVTWNVNGTSAAPINCTSVKISLSTDGGNTFPTVIAASTLNDGTEMITVPNIATTQARIKVEALNNIFFDMSNANFTITSAAVLTKITTSALPNISYCGGTTFNVLFTTDGSANPGNIFYALLSSASGSFASPDTIGSLVSVAAGTIIVTLPAAASGNGYRIRVLSTTPSIVGTDNGTNLIISSAVGAAGAITGATQVCGAGSGMSPYYYSTAVIPNATSYLWTLPAGFVVDSGMNTNTIRLAVSANASSGNITVAGVNGVCTGVVASLAVTATQSPSPTASNVSGCAGTPITLIGSPAGGFFDTPNPYTGNSTSYMYLITTGGCTFYSTPASITVNPLPTVSFSGLASSYNVSTPAVTLTGSPVGGTFGGTGISGSTFNPATAGVGGPYTITYTYSNGCSNSSSQQTTVTGTCTTPAMPGTISTSGGAARVCPGDSKTYSISLVSGATSYTWTPPVGATIGSGQGTNAVVVNYNAGFVASDTVHVVANNACGSSLQNTLRIVRNTPSTPGTITGQTFGVCNLNAIPYSVTTAAGITYNWTFSVAGATVATGQGSNAVTANFGAGYVTGSVRVTANNGCGASAMRTLTVRATPSTPVSITGATSVCANQFGVPYSTIPVASATNYTWTCPSGARINDGAVTSASTTLTTTATSVTVNYSTSTGTVRVRANNTCGSGSYRSITISIVCRDGIVTSSTFPVTCFPMPASDELNVTFLSSAESKYRALVTDVSGKLLREQNGISFIGQNEFKLSLTDLSPGLYMLDVRHGDERSIQKIVKE